MHVLLFSVLGLLQVFGPERLKLGAFTSHLQWVALVEDVIMVQYPLATLLSVPIEIYAPVFACKRSACCIANALCNNSPVSSCYGKILACQAKTVTV